MTDFTLENAITGKICGLDEVGRGPLAGPVVAACVYIPDNVRPLPFVSEITDSKKLSWSTLERLHDLIIEHCVCAIAESCPRMIEEMNILQASLDAMRRAYEAIAVHEFSHALIDGTHCPALPLPMSPVKKGDSISRSIAAASIVAKVTRDRQMKALAIEFPHYGWESNVGYPAQQHRDGIDQYGITEHHRKNFAPVRNYIEHGTTKPEIESGSGSQTRLRA